MNEKGSLINTILAVFIITAFCMLLVAMISLHDRAVITDALNHGVWYQLGNNTYVGLVEKGIYNKNGSVPVVKYTIVFAPKEQLKTATITLVSKYETKRITLEIIASYGEYNFAFGKVSIKGYVEKVVFENKTIEKPMNKPPRILES